jgi:hypothetical protein
VYFHGFDELSEYARQFIIGKNFSYENRNDIIKVKKKDVGKK